VKSVRIGNSRSSKYIYWTEIEAAYSQRHSLVLYQHFPREDRVAFVQRVAKQLKERLKAPAVDSFRTAHVVFFLVSRPEHLSQLRRARDCVLQRWGAEIEVVKEHDFSKGERGKFYRPGVELNIPVYLEPDVAKAVRKRARTTDASIGAVVNEWLRKDLRSANPARKRKVR